MVVSTILLFNISNALDTTKECQCHGIVLFSEGNIIVELNRERNVLRNHLYSIISKSIRTKK